MVWFNNLVALLVVLGIAGIIAFFSPIAAALVLALALAWFVIAQSRNTQKLYDWLLAPQLRSVPESSGSWGEIFDNVSRFMRSEQHARDALTEEIEQIRESIDRLPDALIVLDDKNVIQWCNAAAENLLGVFASRRPITQFIRQPEFGRYLKADSYDAPLELELSTRPGRIFEVRIHDTEDRKRLLISRDITEQAMLNQMRSDFVANVSHEIRTPVTVIGGFAETMLDLDLDEAKRREYLGTIVRNSHTMQRLVEDLLTLSSLEAMDTTGLNETIDLARLFTTLAGEARDLSNGRHEIRSEPPRGLSILGRTAEIESAIRNFLTNAVRYTPENGTISLEWKRSTDKDGWISVRDNGIGIAAEHLPRLSERFYRVDRGRSRATGGTGLGLAIVKRIANRHNASLHIDSVIGEGSTFSLILPKSRIKTTDGAIADAAADTGAADDDLANKADKSP